MGCRESVEKKDKGAIYVGLDTLIVHEGSSWAFPLKDTNTKTSLRTVKAKESPNFTLLFFPLSHLHGGGKGDGHGQGQGQRHGHGQGQGHGHLRIIILFKSFLRIYFFGQQT